MDTLGERIRFLRESNNLTQTELSEMLGMKTYTTVSKWESNDNFPKGKDLKKLAETFNVSSDYLLGLKAIRNEKDITSIYNELEPPRQKIVYNTAEKQLKEQKNKVVQFPNKDNNELKLYSERKAKPQPLAGIYLLGAAAAGTGEFVLEEHVEKISLPENIIPHSADFCLIVNGDSMEPVILDDSYVFIDRTNEISSGTIAAVMVNGDAYIKRVWFENGHARLESFNDKYEDIIVTEEDDFYIIGKVVM